jgi:hypothetical protein
VRAPFSPATLHRGQEKCRSSFAIH